MADRFRVQRYRFSVERASNGCFVVVDWALGLIHGAGRGQREEQERALVFIKAYVRRHGTVNLTRLPKRLSVAPRWPLGGSPAPRPGWQAEQRRIASAFARIGEIIRERKMDDAEMGSDLDVLMAKRVAERLCEEARRRVGMP